jgi:hypothetical protein
MAAFTGIPSSLSILAVFRSAAVFLKELLRVLSTMGSSMIQHIIFLAVANHPVILRGGDRG